MIQKLSLLAVVALSLLSGSLPAEARRGDQEDVREDMRTGKLMKLREIESSVIPRMRGLQYLGPEYLGEQVYRLKFIDGGRVIFVDVDARTGGVLRQR